MAESLKKKTVKGVIWSAIERFAVSGIGFLFSIILARLLLPSDYGLIAMLTIFMAVAQTFIDSGFSTALVRKPDRTEADNATVFYFNIVISVVCYLIIFFCAPLIADFYNEEKLIWLSRIIALTLVIGSLAGVHGALLSIKLDFKTQAKITLSATIVSGIVGIMLAYLGWGVWALAFQQVLASIIRTILFWIYVKWWPKERFSKKSFKEMFSFGSKLLASGLLDTLYNNIYVIVIGKIFSSRTLGLFSRAEHWCTFIAPTFTAIIQRVSFPVLSTIQNEDDRLRLGYRKILKLSAFIIFPLMMGLAAIGEPLIRITLTDKWIECVPLMQILCFSMMWYPIHAINLNLLQVKGRSDLFLKLEIYKKILGVIILCVTIPMGLYAMCYGRIVSSILCLALNTFYTGKLIHLGFFYQMKDLLFSLINSMLMGGLVYLSILYLPNIWLQLVLGILIGAVYYIFSAYLFKPMEWKELVLILKRK